MPTAATLPGPGPLLVCPLAWVCTCNIKRGACDDGQREPAAGGVWATGNVGSHVHVLRGVLEAGPAGAELRVRAVTRDPAALRERLGES